MRRFFAIIFIMTILFGGCAAKNSNNASAEQKTRENSELFEENTVKSTTNEETKPIETQEKYKSNMDGVCVRSSPEEKPDNVVGELNYGEIALVTGKLADFYIIEFDGGTAYCHSENLYPHSEKLYAYLPAETEIIRDKNNNIVYKEDGITPDTLTNTLADIRLYIENIEIYQIFATDDNFTGKRLYPRAVPLLQLETIEKLKRAAEIFEADGYTIKLYDAYRPLSVQRELFEIVKDPTYIADPDDRASNHNRGAAADISLLDADGEELDFPSPIHTMDERSNRDNKNWTDVQTKNVSYMTKVMVECGFVAIKSEWWHFADAESAKYMTTDVDLSKIQMLPERAIKRD